MAMDFTALASALLSQSNILLPDWFPAGKQIGRDWAVGNLAGEPGQSLRINLDTGLWIDRATGESGGDLTALYAAAHHCSQIDAARTLANGHDQPEIAHSASQSVLGRPPDDAPAPNFRHRNHGEPVATYAYRDVAGRLLYYIARYEPATGGGKQFCPFTWDGTKWRMVGYPAPRPLFGLEQLAGSDRHALIVEGEKACLAARAFIAGRIYDVLTWPGGAQSVAKVDWTPIHGRKVLLWPDADPPGRAAMETLAQLLAPHCPEVKLINVDGLRDGWDAADAQFDSVSDFVAWARPLVSLWNNVPRETVRPAKVAKSGPTGLVQSDGAVAAKKPKPDRSVERDARANLSAVMTILTRSDYRDCVRYDVFHRKLLKPDGSHFKDPDFLRLTERLQVEWLDKVEPKTVKDAVVLHGDNNQCNEVVEWLDTLQWDGVDRLRMFCPRYLGAEDNEYTRAVGQNFWKSLIARCLYPGCKVDFMLILQGVQAAGKSTAMGIIAGKWYVETHEKITSKDFLQGFGGKLIIDCGDMGSFNRADLNKVKQVITTATDSFRKSFGHLVEDYPRRCIFTGSTNEDVFLEDVTGARRFFPVLCGAMDVAALRADREQLFAEALLAVRRGEPWHIFPLDESRREQEARRVVHPWEDILASYLTGLDSVPSSTLFADALKIDPGRQSMADQHQLGRSMRALGWSNKLTWLKDSAKPIRLWRRL